MSEIYVSTDVETDGPIPGPYSMLSFGSAAYWHDGVLLGTFSANLLKIGDTNGHPSTMEFWAEQPAAYQATRINMEEPAAAMGRYVTWLKELPGTPVFVAYPAGFDFLFVYWYLMKYVGESPFSFSALDIKTFAMAQLRCNYRGATKRNMPKRWFSKSPHTHIALDDAIEQGALFCAMLAENRQK